LKKGDGGLENTLSPKNISDPAQNSKIDRESECEQLLKKVRSLRSKNQHQKCNMVAEKNDDTLMGETSQYNKKKVCSRWGGGGESWNVKKDLIAPLTLPGQKFFGKI
jgi:hypothetical protein